MQGSVRSKALLTKQDYLMQSINERVSAMGFQEATTEIWSVDSQYSKDNGVMVLVTGSLQCKVTARLPNRSSATARRMWQSRREEACMSRAAVGI